MPKFKRQKPPREATICYSNMSLAKKHVTTKYCTYADHKWKISKEPKTNWINRSNINTHLSSHQNLLLLFSYFSKNSNHIWIEQRKYLQGNGRKEYNIFGRYWKPIKVYCSLLIWKLTKQTRELIDVLGFIPLRTHLSIDHCWQVVLDLGAQSFALAISH